MDDTTPRPPRGVFLSVLMSVGLLVLFFMPWLRLSCNPQAATNAVQLRGMQNVPEDLTKPTVLARASGWDLARGKLTPEKRFRGQARAQENAEDPPAKPWAYAGLVLPGLVVGFGLLCMSGKLTFTGAGKWMVVLGISGVVLMFVAASMDYIDEAMDVAEEKMVAQGVPVGRTAFRRDVAVATEQFKKVIQTKTTPYLWASLAMYVLIAGCGVATAGVTQYVPTESVAWRHDSEATGGDRTPGRTMPDRDRRAPSAPVDLGPSLAPMEAPAPVGDDADSQT